MLAKNCKNNLETSEKSVMDNIKSNGPGIDP